MEKRSWIDTFNVVGVLLGLGFSAWGLHQAAQAMKDTNKIASARYVLAVSKRLDDSAYDKVSTAIDSHPASYKLAPSLTRPPSPLRVEPRSPSD